MEIKNMNWRHLAILCIILGTFSNYATGRNFNTTKVLLRQRRQQGAQLYLTGSYIVPDGEGSGEGWGPWSSPSQCSRTCGGGVAMQTRRCYDIGYDGSPTCQGGEKKYYSCNTQDCSEDSKDYRSEQCSEFDSTPYEGIQYQWVPYTKAPNPCELNCMPRGERFYYRHNTKVVDGTRCDDESLNVCVDGTCQPVGCDMMLGSNAREDKCRECNGDGSSCKTTQGEYNKDDLTAGYNDLLLIPQGATNIVIKERRSSNNYLAIRNKAGEFYLNGNWRIDFPRAFTFAGAIWHYERQPQGFAAPDTIRALGPTSEPLYLVMLYQDTNVGVDYEYSVPQEIAQNVNDEYAWVHDTFTHCSASCGGGYQIRNVTCASRQELVPVDESLCDAALRPASNQSCANTPCAARWAEGPWGECSAACGDGGSQARQIYCYKVVTQGLPSVVDDDECFQILGPKPPQHQKCNVGLPCPTWHVGPYTPCDKLCGEGKQRRNVRCYRKVDGKIEVLDDGYCKEEKPEVEMSCFIHPCDGLDWIISEWNGCDSCLSKVKTRTAHCATQQGDIFPSSFCSNHPDPELQADCDPAKLPACDTQWYTSQWSECSGKCGDGVQSRRVFCGIFNGEALQKVDDERCNITKKPEDIRPCELEEKDCPAEWHAGPWTECSKPCGGGEQSRKVLCLRENKTVAATDCEEADILDSNQACNAQPCTEDEVLPVDGASTLPVTDYDEEDWCDEDEYDEEDTETGVTSAMDGSSEVTSLDDLMMSDGPSYSTDETGSGDQYYSMGMDTEISSLDFGSGESVSPDEDMSTKSFSDTSTETSDLTSDVSTDSSVSTESTSSELSSSGATDASTDSSAVTDSSASTDASSESSSVVESSTDGSSSTDASSSDSSASETSASDSSSSTDSSTDASSASESSTDSSSESSTDSSAATDSSKSTDADSSTTDASSTDGSSTDHSSTDASSTDSSSTDSSSTDSSSTDSSSTDSSSTDASSTDSSSTDASSTDSSSTDGSSTDASSTDASSTDASTTDATTDSTTDSDTLIPPVDNEVGPKDSESESTKDSSSSSESSSESSTEFTTSSSDADSSSTIESSTDSSGLTTEAELSSESGISTTESDQTTVSGLSTDLSSTDSSTDAESSTVSGLSTDISSTDGSTESGATDATEESTSEGSTIESSTDITSTDSSTDTTESTSEVSTDTSSSEESTTEWETSTWGWSLSTLEEAVGKESTKKCKKRPKKPATCLKSKFGCCYDNKTEATGPFEKGCPNPETCKETKHGCCPDGVSPATGPKNKGCPSLPCNETLYGCCDDEKTPAEGNNKEGCPPPPPKCKSSKFGCCADGETEAQGPKKKGCPESEVPTTKGPAVPCGKTKHGCCEDKKTAASGPKKEGCDCSTTKHGCCHDDYTPATGPNFEGCGGCNMSTFGCCPDNETPAHGPNRDGCCLTEPHKCCPDNVTPARGPNFEGCGCQWSPYGCCPDNQTVARGYNNEGCGCQYTPHGCCPNRYTPALGPEYEGCPCYTYQFGCCPDGKRIARGPYYQGCRCRDSEFGCCSDDQTEAQGPDKQGCDCASSKYGCCPDGVAEAQGEDFDGCADKPDNLQVACKLEKERGTCRNYTVRWYYDLDYGGCSRFWYNGCDGNANRFKTQEECKDICVQPTGRDRCKLPKIKGPCDGYFPTWYYDTDNKHCAQFIYGGCLGNNNRFPTREECAKNCDKTPDDEICSLETDPGTCAGNYTRWAFNKDSHRCEPFTWGGCQGNANKFVSESACILQCDTPGKMKDMCLLPRAAGNCTEKIPKWFFDREENRCMPFYYTGCEGNDNQFDTEQLCDKSCPKVVVQDVCTLPSLTGDCAEYRERWFYDSAEKRCRQFYYGGCGGNSNNFPTEQECESRCKEQAPTTVAQPPEPFNTESCFLSSDVGPCRAAMSRWSYDSHDGVCKQFLYGGCEGNGNNFNTREECEQQCSNVQDVCQLPMTVGPCDGSVTQWFYEQNSDSCSQFTYGGCQGNNNRFNSREECEHRCKRGRVDSTEDPNAISPVTQNPRDVLPPSCSAPMEIGRCSEQLPLWFYDVNSGECRSFLYSGCDGNGNRFVSEEQCLRQCGHFRGLEVCRYHRDTNSCEGNYRKFYYDESRGQCLEFVWEGCSVYPNRFSSAAECNSVCIQRQELSPDVSTPEETTAVCSLPVDQGSCDSTFYRRWYYSEESELCIAFIYTGCGGNANNFKSFDACMKSCSSEDAKVVNRFGENEPREEYDPCKEYREECTTLRCPYGETRAILPDGCERCACHDPCLDTRCEEDSMCVVDFYRDEAGETKFNAICRLTVKPGECPTYYEDIDENSLAPADDNECSRDCRNDADCSGDDKCCQRGCSLICVPPKSQYQPAYTVEPSYTKYPSDVEAPRVADEDEQEPEVEASEGDVATLKCLVYGHPAPTITWKKGSILIDGTSGRHKILTDGTLQIISLYRNDSGVYICIAENGVGPAVQREVNLQVNEPLPKSADIIPGETNIVGTLGSPLILRCLAYGYPPPTIQWWHGNNMLPIESQDYERRRDFSLVIRSLKVNQLGKYTCDAWNGIGKPGSSSIVVQAVRPVNALDPIFDMYKDFLISSIPSIHVTPRPHYRYSPTAATPETHVATERSDLQNVYIVPVSVEIKYDRSRFQIGSDISLHCNADGYPIPHVVWTKDGRQLSSGSRIEISESNRLTVYRVNSSDSGEYRCDARNQYSSAYSSLTINIEGTYIHPNCTDNPFFANCKLIVKANYCNHKYYAKFCCRSCTLAGLLPSYGPHIDESQSPASQNSLRRK